MTSEKPSADPEANRTAPSVEVEFRFTLALPYHLRVADSVFEGRVGRNAYLFHVKSVYAPLRREGDTEGRVAFKPFTGEITTATGAEIPGAMLRYSLVCVQFAKRCASDNLSEDEANRALKAAHRCLNHFLDLYRFQFQDTAIRPLTRRELHQVRAGRALHRLTSIKQEGKSKLSFGVIFDEDDAIQLGPPVPLDDVATNELRRVLKASVVPTLSGLLLLNAESYLRSGEERLAVLDMNTAFDITVEAIALRVVVSKGTAVDVAKQRLEGMTTRNIIARVLEKHLALNWKSDPEWIAWDTSCRILRNRMIHDGYTPTAEETKDSLRIIRALCLKLDPSHTAIRKPAET